MQELSLLQRLIATGTDRDVIEPFTGDVLYSLPTSTEADVDAAFERARAVQPGWAAMSLASRCAVMLRFHDLLLTNRHAGLDLVQRETGKARKDANEEVLDVCITARHYSRDAHRLLRPRRHLGALPGLVGVTELRVPKGVVGVISPWNYPVTLAASDAIPAMIAGNAIVLKPDVQTTLSALWIADLLAQAGLPEGVFTVVSGEGPVVGPWVIDRSDYVMFTGSTAVGRQVAARCGDRLIGCSMELGGKNAMIVRADSDAEVAASIAVRGSFSNSGQLCISMERIYVHDSIYEEFLAAFARRTDGLRMSAHVGWGSDVGSLISQKQLDRVSEHVDDAAARGATVVVGGKARPDIGPYFFAPTILTGVDDSMTLCSVETFGPVVAVYPVGSDEEAVRRANDTEYGLNASVVSRDNRAAQAIARQLRAGTVNVNEGYAAAWASKRAPMGGMGASGLGRRHGDEGMLKYTEAQTIATQRALGFGPQFGWSDERWGDTLASAMGLMKKLGLK
ncbi:MAG: succinic semialdehyde dehydrogenase [Candidatus Nanopelagicales bacterium]